jgi:hypothetical protein
MTSRPGSQGARVLAGAAEGDDREDHRRVAAEVAHVLADGPYGSGTGVEQALALSLSMARHRIGPADLVDALRLLRQAVLEVSRLDPDREPVPLAAGEPRVAAVNVAVYVSDLLGRAATVTGCGRVAMARMAATHLTRT